MPKKFRLPFFHTRRPDADDSAAHGPAFCLSPVNSKALDIDFPSPTTPRPLLLHRHRPGRRRRCAPPIVSLGCLCQPSSHRRRRNPYVDMDVDAEPSRARETPACLWSTDEDEDICDHANEEDDFAEHYTYDEDDDGGGGVKSLVSYTCYRRSSESVAFRVREAEGKVKESFAVAKRSEDPHRDFRRSIAEMIVEKQMYEPRELEQLLQCMLSLNSRHHHPAIVSAFTEIWEALFPPV